MLMISDEKLIENLIGLLSSIKMDATSDFDCDDSFTDSDVQLRPAGVLVLIDEHLDGARVILTKRTSALKHHAGQIAFPGGAFDDGDVTLENTALREAHEEIGLNSDVVKLIGRLPQHKTATGFIVTPILAKIPSGIEFNLQKEEVAELFTVPLNFLADSDNYSIMSRVWKGGKRSYPVVPYGPYYIWGATARMLYSMATILGPNETQG